MTKLISKAALIPTALFGLMLAMPSAQAEVSVGETLGTSEAAIIAALEAKGYTIEEIETEDGEIEVEVMLNGAEMEIEIAADTGAVTEVEMDDEDDSDDDDSDEDDDDNKQG